MIEKITDFYWYYVRNLQKYERRLTKYQGYGKRSVLEFKRRNNLEWDLVQIILENFVVVDGLELRNYIRDFATREKELVFGQNTYFTHFGPAEKSGSFILNQFTHCYPSLHRKVIQTKDLNDLSEGDNVIFLDDFVGTGTQALTYIRSIQQLINSSVKPHLFVLCATEKGLKRIADLKSKFTIHFGRTLERADFFLLDETCLKFSSDQKKIVGKLNSLLGANTDFNQNIPFALYYTIPDNSLPLLWLDGDKYKDKNGSERVWYGLTPRNF